MVVPKNVYIIGTMNSVDKSLSDLDAALLDRFAVYNMPEIELDISKLGNKQSNVTGVELVALTIRKINNLLSKDVLMKKDNQIGNRALFNDYSNIEELILTVKYDIKPKVLAKTANLKDKEKEEIENLIDKLINDLESGGVQ